MDMMQTFNKTVTTTLQSEQRITEIEGRHQQLTHLFTELQKQVFSFSGMITNMQAGCNNNGSVVVLPPPSAVSNSPLGAPRTPRTASMVSPSCTAPVVPSSGVTSTSMVSR